MAKVLVRCAWAESDPLLRAYHDEEWGRPEHDARALWECLMLEGFQAGLSWLVVLRKREGFRKAFKGFDPEKVAKMNDADVDRLMLDPGIVRARAKIEATIGGARSYLSMQSGGEDFSDVVWRLVGGEPILRRANAGVPAKTELSASIAKTLKKRGFTFVGPTIVYAWMQAVGMVDDHYPTCFRHRSRTKKH